jgi:hypothetical protein
MAAVRILPAFPVGGQLAGEPGAGIAQVPADGILGLAECLGYLLPTELFHDELHDLALRRRQAAEHRRNPLLVFPRGQPAVFSIFLRGDMASFN